MNDEVNYQAPKSAKEAVLRFWAYLFAAGGSVGLIYGVAVIALKGGV